VGRVYSTHGSDEKIVYKVLAGKPEEEKPLEKPTRWWEDDIKMDYKESGFEGVDKINLTQDGD
jgi:hypothetical protein